MSSTRRRARTYGPPTATTGERDRAPFQPQLHERDMTLGEQHGGAMDTDGESR